MKKLALGLFVALMSIANSFVFGADSAPVDHTVTMSMTETALIAISGNVSLGVGGKASGGDATVAGEALSTSAENTTTRLKISTAKQGTAKRDITVSVDKVPETTANVTLTAEALAPNANFNALHGSMGTLNTKTLSMSDQSLVSGITGVCWSGVTGDDGYGIKYAFAVLDGKTLINSIFTVTYTLSEAP